MRDLTQNNIMFLSYFLWFWLWSFQCCCRAPHRPSRDLPAVFNLRDRRRGLISHPSHSHNSYFLSGWMGVCVRNVPQPLPTPRPAGPPPPPPLDAPRPVPGCPSPRRVEGMGWLSKLPLFLQPLFFPLVITCERCEWKTFFEF